MRTNVSALVVLVLMTMCGVSIATVIKPEFDLKDLNPIDACLFACNMCYEKEMLLTCANSVCLKDLVSGKRFLGRLWQRSCPGLAQFFKRK